MEEMVAEPGRRIEGALYDLWQRCLFRRRSQMMKFNGYVVIIFRDKEV